MDEEVDLSIPARRALARGLSTIGLEPSPGAERLVVDDGLELKHEVLGRHTLAGGRGFAVSLAIEVTLPGEPFPLREPMAGVGRTLEAALDDAVRGWIEGVLGPLRAARAHAAGAPDAEAPRFDLVQVHPATADAPERPVAWDVFAGPLLLRGEPRAELAEALEERPPFVVLADAEGGLPTFDAARRFAWLRLFAARQHDRDGGAEVQVDNAPWARGIAALDGLPWPRVPGFLSVRQLFVLVRRD